LSRFAAVALTSSSQVSIADRSWGYNSKAA
jgi:hypothetical protein